MEDITESCECAHCGQRIATLEEVAFCGNDCGTAYCGDACADAHWGPGQHWELCGKSAAGHSNHKWMSHLHLHKGALKHKAKAKHETVAEYTAHPPKGISGKTKKQIALAKTFAKANHHRGK